MFDVPDFTVWNVLYTASATLTLWGSFGKPRLRATGLPRVVGLLPLSRKNRERVELVLFVALGVIVGIGVTAPVNPSQAISAGLAWTGALCRPEASVEAPRRAKAKS